MLQIFDKIRLETGWRVGFLNKELKERWGWSQDEQHSQTQPQQIGATGLQNTTPLRAYSQQQQQQQQQHQQQDQQQQSSSSMMGPPPPSSSSLPPAPAAAPRIPSGILNPILATADFSMPQHPYQSYYVAPNPIQNNSHFTY